MSISAVLNRWLNRLYKILAILLVLIAVLISAFRLSLPYAQHFQQDFQHYLNETYDSNVTIGLLSMEWAGNGPAIVVEDVNVLDTETAHLFVARLGLTLDFWGSLQHQKLITKNITLAGAQVFFDKKLLKHNSEAENDSSLVDTLSDVFFQQIHRLSLTNSKITIQDELKTRTFLVDQLAWVNRGKHHRASGSMLIDGLTANNIKFNLDVSGQELNDLSGQLYLEANQLNVTPWLDKVFAIENEKTYSSVNFNAWYTLDKGKASELQIALGDNEVSWFYEDEIHTLHIEGGDILVENLADKAKIITNTSPLHFYSNNNAWQPLTVSTQQTTNGLLTYISSLELFGLANLYPLFSGHLESQQLLNDLAPLGQINDVYLLKNNDDLKAFASFSNVNSSFSQGIPGVENISGELSLAQQSLNIKLVAENGKLDFDKHFQFPIPYQSIAAQVNVDFSSDDLSVKVQQIEVMSEQLHATADLEISALENEPLNMALLANIHRGDAKLAHYYYPQLLMGQDLVDYLNSAIIEGEVEQAQVLFNGPLDKFPFHGQEGIFIVDAELTNSRFQFDPSWPVINDFEANLNFTNNSMLITGRGGELTGIDVTGVQVAIDDLEDQQVLTVAASFKNTQPKAVSDLMNNSPMADTVGETLNQLQVSKTISGSFALNLPLNDVDSVVASGTVDFKNNQLNLQTPEMIFTEVNGKLSYKNDVINTEGLSLNWREMPLAISVMADNKHKDYYQTLINLQAKWPEASWKKELPQLLEKYGHGQLDWRGDLTLKMHNLGGFSYDLLLGSDFETLDFSLPVPYKKVAGEALNVTVKVSGQEGSSVLNAQVGGELNFYGELNHNKVQFTKAHLVLGNETMLLPVKGFHITTNLSTASLTEWQPLVSDIIDSLEQQPSISTEDNVAILAAPKRIRGEVKKLDILGQKLTDVSFSLLDKEQWWLLDLQAKEARTKAKFFPDWHQQGIEIDADFIHLASAGKKSTEKGSEQQVDDKPSNDVIFANIPPIQATCTSCTFGKLDFGQVDFSLERSAVDTLEIKKFTAKRGKTEMSFDANWQHNQKVSKTTVIGKLKAKNFDREMEKLGYPSTIKDSGVSLSYSFDWQDSPFDFKLENFNGTSKVRFSDGYLAEVDDKARAFSLLSLQSLVRKLKLDFRDIFSDGMFYDSIKGDFQVKNGIIYTDNTFMKGAAGDMSIKGNTDLNAEMLDYKISYKPNITSSLPAIAWITTLNPLVVIGALALDGVITSKVVSEIKFEVTGPIDNPVEKQVDRKTQNIRVGRSTPPEVIDTLTEDSVGSEAIQENKSSGIKDHKGMNLDG
jgi:uncharacterized protein (TIGR02099 family)